MTCLAPVLRFRLPEGVTLDELAALPAYVQRLEARIAQLEARKPSPALAELVDAHEAGRILGMTAAAVRAAARRGTLKAVHVGRRVRFSRSTLT